MHSFSVLILHVSWVLLTALWSGLDRVEGVQRTVVSGCCLIFYFVFMLMDFFQVSFHHLCGNQSSRFLVVHSLAHLRREKWLHLLVRQVRLWYLQPLLHLPWSSLLREYVRARKPPSNKSISLELTLHFQFYGSSFISNFRDRLISRFWRLARALTKLLISDVQIVWTPLSCSGFWRKWPDRGKKGAPAATTRWTKHLRRRGQRVTSIINNLMMS